MILPTMYAGAGSSNLPADELSDDVCPIQETLAELAKISESVSTQITTVRNLLPTNGQYWFEWTICNCEWLYMPFHIPFPILFKIKCSDFQSGRELVAPTIEQEVFDSGHYPLPPWFGVWAHRLILFLNQNILIETGIQPKLSLWLLVLRFWYYLYRFML